MYSRPLCSLCAVFVAAAVDLSVHSSQNREDIERRQHQIDGLRSYVVSLAPILRVRDRCKIHTDDIRASLTKGNTEVKAQAP
jgi:hypothetical protein